MAARINISIPEDLHERLTRFKDNLNMSRICQEAIGRAVRLEELKAENTDIETLVERLKEEELQVAQKYVDEGFECGVKDAYGLSLDQFLQIDTWGSDNYDWHDESAPFFPSKETVRALKEFDERTNFIDGEWNMVSNDHPGMYYALEPKNYFVRGWMDGVFNVWKEVKYKLIGLQDEPKLLKIVCDEDDNED